MKVESDFGILLLGFGIVAIVFIASVLLYNLNAMHETAEKICNEQNQSLDELVIAINTDTDERYFQIICKNEIKLIDDVVILGADKK